MFRPFFILISISGLLALTACGPSSGSGREAKGGRVYGGTLKLSETEKFQTLNPLAITDVNSSNIAYQIYEGLLKFNPKNPSEVLPSLAESYTISEDGKVYTFKLKKGIHFHDDPCFSNGKGREINAGDVVWSLTQLCTQTSVNQQFKATFKGKVKGADEYYASSANGNIPAGGVSGISAPDAGTVQITLNEPLSSFKYIMALPGTFVLPKEAYERYGDNSYIGSGPFLPVNPDAGKDELILVRNENYHGTDSLGNQLPFLDSVEIRFYPTKAKELDAFMQGNLDVVFGLPPEQVSQIVQNSLAAFENNPPKYELVRTPELETQYYEINTSRKPFDDVRVRQAFCYAINRMKIFEDILKGEGYGPGHYGLVPPAFRNYDTSAVRGYSYNPEKAKKLMADAGFPGGKGFPIVKIELNSGGAKHSRVVEEIKNQLMDVLNVNVEYEIVPMKQKLEDAQYGRADLFRTAWVADFPSPENFLWTLYGGSVPEKTEDPSYPNVPRYKSAYYDSLYLAGAHSGDLKESYSLFAKAERQMLDDAPVIILWYAENFKLTYTYVKGFHFNPIRQWSLGEVYLKKPSPEEEKGVNEQKEEKN
ncbi:MAG: ABC transporter substrate-binding protein [Bacteroidia bacterium]|nr:ABC transporter substrate-binding protein [Bacteroidia bacterium]